MWSRLRTSIHRWNVFTQRFRVVLSSPTWTFVFIYQHEHLWQQSTASVCSLVSLKLYIILNETKSEIVLMNDNWMDVIDVVFRLFFCSLIGLLLRNTTLEDMLKVSSQTLPQQMFSYERKTNASQMVICICIEHCFYCCFRCFWNVGGTNGSGRLESRSTCQSICWHLFSFLKVWKKSMLLQVQLTGRYQFLLLLNIRQSLLQANIDGANIVFGVFRLAFYI